MCKSVETALEVIKTQHKRTLTKGEIVVLFQQVVSDLSKQGEKMNNLEKEVSLLKEEMRAGFADIKKLIEERTKRLSLFEKIMALSTHKYFWITLIIGLLIVGGLLGVPTTGFNGIISLGG